MIIIFIRAAAPKKTGAAGTTAGGAAKANAVQVIYNGKIVTPQSLISNQKAVASSTHKKAVGHAVTSIPEHEATDKPSPLKGFKKFVAFDVPYYVDTQTKCVVS